MLCVVSRRPDLGAPRRKRQSAREKQNASEMSDIALGERVYAHLSIPTFRMQPRRTWWNLSAYRTTPKSESNTDKSLMRLDTVVKLQVSDVIVGVSESITDLF